MDNPFHSSNINLQIVIYNNLILGLFLTIYRFYITSLRENNAQMFSLSLTKSMDGTGEGSIPDKIE